MQEILTTRIELPEAAAEDKVGLWAQDALLLESGVINLVHYESLHHIVDSQRSVCQVRELDTVDQIWG